MTRRTIPLLCLGCLQAVLYVIIAILSRAFVPGEGLLDRPIPAVLALFGVNFLLYLASAWVVGRVEIESRAVWIIVGFAALFRLTLWPSQPIQEVDLYRYLWDGRVFVAGINPYRHSPAEAQNAESSDELTGQTQKLAKLRRASPALATIFARVHFPEVPTIYPPLSQLVFALAAAVTPISAPLAIHVLVLKGVFLAFDGLTVVLLALLSRRVGLSRTGIIWYAWCPLVLKEFANSAHLDTVAVSLVALTFYLLALLPGPARRIPTLGLAALAGGALGLATLAKLYPLVLLPLVTVWLWRQLGHRVLLPLAVFTTTLLLGYLPFLDFSSIRPRSPWEGLEIYLSGWEMNDLAFALVVENLDPTRMGPEEAWYSLVPRETRLALLGAATGRRGEWDVPENLAAAAMGLARLLTGVIYLALVLGLALFPRRWDKQGPAELCRRAFLTLGSLWFLLPTQNPWYWTWAMPFLVFQRGAWVLVSGAALLYYARFWLEYHYAHVPVLGTGYHGPAFFDFVVVWFEQLPLIGAILVDAAWCRRRDQRSETLARAGGANNPSRVNSA